MLNLSAVPVWGIWAMLAAIFGAGIAFNQMTTSFIVAAQIKTCKKEHSGHLDKLADERKEIWEIVRKTETNTALTRNDIKWIKENMRNGVQS